jgi:cytochrome c peroxidase
MPVMIKQPRWLALAFLAMVLACGAAFYLFFFPDPGKLQNSSEPAIVPGIESEPITPIPLDLKLDARKIALGRRLFLDPNISRDNRISCAYCHSLATGGTDRLPHASGVDGRPGSAITQTVFNSGFSSMLFRDGRAATLEELIDFPLPHSAGMDLTWPEVIAVLEQDQAYRSAFRDIYQEGIKPGSVKDALATFTRSLTTPNSKFDRYLRGDQHALDRSELAGYQLFKSLGCISCHQGTNAGGNMYERLGLAKNYYAHRGNVQEADFGRYNLTRNEADRYEFRVPPLRNVALSAPYFHDASARTLDQAVATMARYQLGVDLSAGDTSKLVKFLNTLTGIYQGGTGE